jgi:hypothetical protein
MEDARQTSSVVPAKAGTDSQRGWLSREAGNHESSPNSILWLWVPGLRRDDTESVDASLATLTRTSALHLRLLDVPPLGQVPHHHIEDRREQKAEQGDAEHAEKDRDADGLAHLRAGAGGDD